MELIPISADTIGICIVPNIVKHLHFLSMMPTSSISSDMSKAKKETDNSMLTVAMIICYWLRPILPLRTAAVLLTSHHFQKGKNKKGKNNPAHLLHIE